MAIIRSEIQPNLADRSSSKSTYDIIVTSADDDLVEGKTSFMGIGSMAFALNNQKIYIKLNTGWVPAFS